MTLNKWICLVCSVLLCISSRVVTAQSLHRFIYFLHEVQAQALINGISPPTVLKVLGKSTLLYRKVHHINRHHTHRISFTEYLTTSINVERLHLAYRQWHQHRHLFHKIAAQYHIPSVVLLALWGLETNYGQVQGDYPEIETLLTRAYYNRKRRKMYLRQLIAALRMVDAGWVGAKQMRGSWAGAMGQCQFMPETFLHFAVDSHHRGKKDIWHDHSDVLASMANYLRYLGFNNHHPVLVPVTVRGANRYRGLHSVAYWLDHGVVPTSGHHLVRSYARARLIHLTMDDLPDYLVFNDNFRAILGWNHSTYYALTVGIFADILEHRAMSVT